MGQAESFGERDRIGSGTALVENGQDRGMPAAAIIGFCCQPGTQPKSEYRLLVHKRKRVLKPCLEHDPAGHGSVLAYPQPGQAEGGHSNGVSVAGVLGQLICTLEVLSAGLQVSVDAQGVFAAYKGALNLADRGAD
jgi:hypothetical protein